MDDERRRLHLGVPSERGELGVVATPAVIAENIDFNAGYVRQRISKLLEEGLIEYEDEDRGMYRITERGRKYLSGELDADELESNRNQFLIWQLPYVWSYSV